MGTTPPPSRWQNGMVEMILWRPVQALTVCVLLFLTISVSAQADLDQLRNKIDVGSTEEKRNALFEIRNLRSEQASRIALAALDDPLPIVRATAVSAVIFLPSKEASRRLLAMLDDNDAFVRRETATALGELGDIDACAPLIRAVQKEKEIENRSAAAIALGKLGDPSAIEPLLSVLIKKPVESDEFIRSAAARSIGEIVQTQRFGVRQELLPQNFLPEKYKPRWTANTVIPPETARSFEAAVPILKQVLANTREADETRRSAAFALGAIGDGRSMEILREYAAGKDPYLTEVCKEALLNFTPAK
jgi:HEAT repeat protein